MDQIQEPKIWYNRGYLPHFDYPGQIQGITFRVADSLPQHVLEQLAQEAKHTDNATQRTRIETYLNAGHGSCPLKNPRIARMVQNALLYFDTQRYNLIAWVIMPNHVHVLIETFEGYPLGKVVHSWKAHTARQANKILGRTGRFWFREYFDRYIRDDRHFSAAVQYIHNNPVQAGLVDKAEHWPFSSASLAIGPLRIYAPSS